MRCKHQLIHCLEKVKVKYAWITEAIQTSFKTNFWSALFFQMMKWAIIVIHFATSLERHPVSRDLSVLVIWF